MKNLFRFLFILLFTSATNLLLAQDSPKPTQAKTPVYPAGQVKTPGPKPAKIDKEGNYSVPQRNNQYLSAKGLEKLQKEQEAKSKEGTYSVPQRKDQKDGNYTVPQRNNQYLDAKGLEKLQKEQEAKSKEGTYAVPQKKSDKTGTYTVPPKSKSNYAKLDKKAPGTPDNKIGTPGPPAGYDKTSAVTPPSNYSKLDKKAPGTPDNKIGTPGPPAGYDKTSAVTPPSNYSKLDKKAPGTPDNKIGTPGPPAGYDKTSAVKKSNYGKLPQKDPNKKIMESSSKVKPPTGPIQKAKPIQRDASPDKNANTKTPNPKPAPKAKSTFDKKQGAQNKVSPKKAKPSKGRKGRGGRG